MTPDDYQETDDAPAVQCSTCHAFSYGGDKYCACCGSPVRRLCRSCGAIVLQPVAFFCTQCGERLDEERRRDRHRGMMTDTE